MRELVKLLCALLMVLCLVIPSYGQVQSETKVTIQSDFNIWNIPSLTIQERNLLHSIAGRAESSYTINSTEISDTNIKYNSMREILRNTTDIIYYLVFGNSKLQNVTEGMSVSMSYNPDNQNVNSLGINMDSYTASMMPVLNDNYKNTLHTVANVITTEAGVTSNDTQIDALWKINCWMCNNFIYDQNSYMNTVEQTLETKNGVCGQFSQIIKYSCDYLGINCDICPDTIAVHAYNRVYIDNIPYYIDSTWNITNKNPNGWFLKSESEFATDHNIIY